MLGVRREQKRRQRRICLKNLIQQIQGLQADVNCLLELHAEVVFFAARVHETWPGMGKGRVRRSQLQAALPAPVGVPALSRAACRGLVPGGEGRAAWRAGGQSRGWASEVLGVPARAAGCC